MRRRFSFTLLLALAAALALLPGWYSRAFGQTPAPTGALADSKPYRSYMPFTQLLSIPLYSTSYYIDYIEENFKRVVNGQTVTKHNLWWLGCDLGTRDANLPGPQDSLVILDYGQAWMEEINGQEVYGVWVFSPEYRFAPMEELSWMTYLVADGYWQCSGSADRESNIVLAIGTSNYGPIGGSRTDPFDERARRASLHGRKFAQMVDEAAKKAAPYAAQVSIAAAIDIESWGHPLIARTWADAYELANTNRYPYYNFGSCDGCPTSPSATWKHTITEWTQGDVYYVSWDVESAWPLPEIYGIYGIHASQWRAISLWGVLYGGGQKMEFAGSLTQWQACQQEGGCPDLDNTPEQGWRFLYDRLNADPRTAQPKLRWSSDIRWLVNR